MAGVNVRVVGVGAGVCRFEAIKEIGWLNVICSEMCWCSTVA